MNKKKLFWRKWKRDKTDYNKEVFNNISKVCSKALFDFNINKVDKLSNFKNCKSFYSYVNNKMGSIICDEIYKHYVTNNFATWIKKKKCTTIVICLS